MPETSQPQSMGPITVSHSYTQPPEVVYDAWLNPDSAARWLFTTADSEVVICEIDAKVGGRFRIVDRRKDMGDAEHVGEYLELDRPRRLVFTFAVPQYDPRYTRVTLDFAAGPEGGCDLRLTHEGVPQEWQDKTKQGWGMILAALEKALAS